MEDNGQGFARSDRFILVYAPLILKFGCLLSHRLNRRIQDAIIASIKGFIAQKKPPEHNCLHGLQAIIAKCLFEFAASVGSIEYVEVDSIGIGAPLIIC